MPADPVRDRPQRALVLHGPPAAGKDTITAALAARDDRYQHFRPLKVGAGRTAGYRITSAAMLEALRAAGGIVWETHRYGAVYAIDHAGVDQLLDVGAVPVLHLAEPAAVPVLVDAFPGARWTIVALTCPRDVARARIERRDTGDTAARLAAYDAFVALRWPDLVIDTDQVSPDAAAALIAITAPP